MSQPSIAFAEFPDWFTLRGHGGVYRIDRIRSSSDELVLANVNGREVGRCSVGELRANIAAPAESTIQSRREKAASSRPSYL